MAQALVEYHRKRNFAATAEPRGRKGRARGDLFVVQKHAARRLHYDFRLELDGVLKSWAVTRGPSLVPGEKRLAVHVEDHPLEYANFEGTIPAGEYGGGSVLLWDKGKWIPDGDPRQGYAKGHLGFTLDGDKLKGHWTLVRMRPRPGERGDNWLLIKSKDEVARADSDVLEEEPRSVASGRTIEEIGADKASRVWRSNRDSGESTGAARSDTPRARARAAARTAARRAQPDPAKGGRETAKPPPRPKSARKAALPDFVEPALATLAPSPPGAGWIHEIKFDGYRLQARLDKGKALLLTRNGLDWTSRFAAIAAAIAALPAKSALIDGEAVFEGPTGVSDFAGLQDALKKRGRQPIRFYVFDLLYLNGYDLRPAPLLERKAQLSALLRESSKGPLRFSEQFDGGARLFDEVCRLGGEGVVSKRASAPYRSGRARDWLKVKCVNRQEFVIGGFAPSTASRSSVGALALGYHDGGRLIPCGRVGSGFTQDVARDLFARLERLRVEESPFDAKLSAAEAKGLRFVQPKLVAEVEFRGWTGGGQLRQASYKGLREDKEPKEVVREDAAADPPASPAPPATAARLTHPDRLLWPESGVTKQALAEHYEAVWPYMEPFVARRPLAIVRCPSGISGECFFQKHVGEGMSQAVRRLKDPHEKQPIIAIDDLSGLLGLVQAAALEIHPWGCRVDDLERPDMLIFDFDPGEGVSWSGIVKAARETRERLSSRGLESFVKTSGGKGLHVVAPLKPKADWSLAKAFCKEIAQEMARESPSTYVATMSKAQRRGKIFIDYLRNARGATAVCAYSTRARPNCPVSTPLSWDELDEVPGAAHFTLANLPRRLARLRSDPWADFFKAPKILPQPEKPVRRRA